MIKVEYQKVNHKTVRRMFSYGGSFDRCIAEAWFRADEGNRQKLEDAFADLFERYK